MHVEPELITPQDTDGMLPQAMRTRSLVSGHPLVSSSAAMGAQQPGSCVHNGTNREYTLPLCGYGTGSVTTQLGTRKCSWVQSTVGSVMSGSNSMLPSRMLGANRANQGIQVVRSSSSTVEREVSLTAWGLQQDAPLHGSIVSSRSLCSRQVLQAHLSLVARVDTATPVQ